MKKGWKARDMCGTFSDNDTAINPSQKASEGDFSFCKYRADNSVNKEIA